MLLVGSVGSDLAANINSYSLIYAKFSTNKTTEDIDIQTTERRQRIRLGFS